MKVPKELKQAGLWITVVFFIGAAMVAGQRTMELIWPKPSIVIEHTLADTVSSEDMTLTIKP